MYPELGVKGSLLYSKFLEQVTERKKTNPQYFANPAWPVDLAKECAIALGLELPPKRPPATLLAIARNNNRPMVLWHDAAEPLILNGNPPFTFPVNFYRLSPPGDCCLVTEVEAKEGDSIVRHQYFSYSDILTTEQSGVASAGNESSSSTGRFAGQGKAKVFVARKPGGLSPEIPKPLSNVVEIQIRFK